MENNVKKVLQVIERVHEYYENINNTQESIKGLEVEIKDLQESYNNVIASGDFTQSKGLKESIKEKESLLEDTREYLKLLESGKAESTTDYEGLLSEADAENMKEVKSVNDRIKAHEDTIKQAKKAYIASLIKLHELREELKVTRDEFNQAYAEVKRMKGKVNYQPVSIKLDKVHSDVLLKPEGVHGMTFGGELGVTEDEVLYYALGEKSSKVDSGLSRGLIKKHSEFNTEA